MRLSADIRLARRSRELATIQIRRSGLPESVTGSTLVPITRHIAV